MDSYAFKQAAFGLDLGYHVAEQHRQRLLVLHHLIEQEFGNVVARPWRASIWARLDRLGSDAHMLGRAIAVLVAVVSRGTGEHFAVERGTEVIAGRFPSTCAAGHESAEMLGMVHQQHFQSFPRSPHGAGDAAGRATDHDQVV